MKLNAKGRYSVTAMLDVALHQGEGPVPLSYVAQRQGISQTYLEQLFLHLRRAGLVKSVRGMRGGYLLARALSSISVAEVIGAVNERFDATRCGGRENCQNNEPCLTHGLWEELSREVERFLSGVSLEDMLNWREVRKVAHRQSTHTMQLSALLPREVAQDQETRL